MNLVLRSNARKELYVGHQPGLQLLWRVNRHITVVTLFARLFPGAFVRNTGPARNVTFGEFNLLYRF